MAIPTPATATTVGLKEWAAVVHALLDGRQTVLLRKGGIHEKAFSVSDGHFVVFPTVAHSHRERVRGEHAPLLARGAADVDDEAVTLRCGLRLVEAIPVERADGLPDIEDLHVWTGESIKADRLDFRPRHRLQVLVVAAFELREPVTLPRRDEYGGCRSWLDLPVAWDGRSGRRVHPDDRLVADAARVRAAVG